MYKDTPVHSGCSNLSTVFIWACWHGKFKASVGINFFMGGKKILDTVPVFIQEKDLYPSGLDFKLGQWSFFFVCFFWQNKPKCKILSLRLKNRLFQTSLKVLRKAKLLGWEKCPPLKSWYFFCSLHR